MVLAMGYLPREVWNKEQGVTDPASGVIQDLGWGECLVTALMSKNPETSGKEPLDDGINCPQSGSDRCVWDVLWGNKCVEEHEGSCQTGKIASNICQSLRTRSLKAMLWNGAKNIIDAVVWDLEFIAVTINELSELIFL